MRVIGWVTAASFALFLVSMIGTPKCPPSYSAITNLLGMVWIVGSMFLAVLVAVKPKEEP